MHSRLFRPSVSTSKIRLQMRKEVKKDHICVVVGSVINDPRCVSLPPVKVCGLRFTVGARRAIESAGGQCLTFDQLAMISPKGSKCVLIRGKVTKRKQYKSFGAPGVPGSHAVPKLGDRKNARMRGRGHERGRGRRASKAYKKKATRSLKSKRSIQMECESTKEENVIIENNQEISEQELFSKKDIARISTKKFCISPSNACCLWDFDVFGFEEKDLFPLLHSMFAKLNCIGKLCVPQESLIHFLYDVHFHYFSNPYHNFRHAIDVLQSTFFILIECEANKFFSDLEIFSMAIAAFVHDVGHTGFSNAFLVNTSSPLALCYNDKSVLENFHCSLTFSLLRKAENDIFSGIDLAQRRLSRQIIVDCILATDLSLHWDLIGRFNVLATRIAAEMESLESSLSSPIAMSSSERTLFMQQIIKCADISNPARCFRVAKLWAERVQQEFFLQGDKEKQLELTVSPFMDRANPQLAKMQISFIDTFVNPSFEVLSKMVPKLRPQCKQLEENRSRWQSKLRQ